MSTSRFRRVLPLFTALVLMATPALAGDAPAKTEKTEKPVLPAALRVEAPDRVLRPMLWKVTGKGLQEPSYLFGTIHLSDPRITNMHPLSRAAFRKSATLHTEIKMEDADNAEMLKSVMRTDGKKLADVIGPELSKQLDAELKHINPLMSAAILQPLKTWAVAVSLGSLEDQVKGGIALDHQLWNKAKAAGKRCEGLETMAEHTGGFETLTADEQLLMLKGALEGQAKQREGKSPITQATLVALYLRGDDETIGRLEELGEELETPTPEEKALGGKIKRFLLIDRNKIMAKAIMKECGEHPEQSHFFAAGSAHFAGEGNVRELLEKEGYTIERLGAPLGEPVQTPAKAPEKSPENQTK